MPHTNPRFWFALIGLLLMVAGFLVQQSTKIPLIERLIAGTAVEAKQGLGHLLSKSAGHRRDLGFGGNLEGLPAISGTDTGFNGLVSLYSAMLAKDARSRERIGKISRIIDACALVPDNRGFANLVVVEWEGGSKTRTSYEEIRELIDEEFDASIRPWQYWLFFVGLSVNVATIILTYFMRHWTREAKADEKEPNDLSTKTVKWVAPPPGGPVSRSNPLRFRRSSPSGRWPTTLCWGNLRSVFSGREEMQSPKDDPTSPNPPSDTRFAHLN
jgi:hypothetical protein